MPLPGHAARHGVIRRADAASMSAFVVEHLLPTRQRLTARIAKTIEAIVIGNAVGDRVIAAIDIDASVMCKGARGICERRDALQCNGGEDDGPAVGP